MLRNRLHPVRLEIVPKSPLGMSFQPDYSWPHIAIISYSSSTLHAPFSFHLLELTWPQLHTSQLLDKESAAFSVSGVVKLGDSLGSF